MRCVGVGCWLLLCGCGRIGFADLSAIADDDANDSDAANPSGFSSLVAYGDQTCALYKGTAYCWGRNDSGQIGDGTNNDATTPSRVLLPAGNVDALSAGDVSGCAIVAGDLYCWGTPNGTTPIFITLPAPATAVAAGKNFSCVIADVVRCWGQNDTGQCGTGDVAQSSLPVPVVFTPAYPATQVDAGDDHACAFAPGQPPQCWGHNDSGALGTGSMNPTTSLSPVNVIGGIDSLPRIAGWHACALIAGNVWCWGENNSGELGNSMTVSSATPVMVTALTNVTAYETGGGPVDHDSSCAVSDGAVWCWGRGEFGRLGYGMTTSQSTPIGVVGLPGPAMSVAVGFAHACALLVDSDIWCWGRGDQGQLGDGNQADSLVPVKVVAPST